MGNTGLIALVCVLLLTACAGQPPQPVKTREGIIEFPVKAYQRLVRDGGHVYRVDEGHSYLRIYVFRAGALASVGHNHIIDASRLRGAFGWLKNDWSTAHADLYIPVAALRVDPPNSRGDWAATFGERPDASARRGTMANLRSEAGLAADAYPRVRVSLDKLLGVPPRPIAQFIVNAAGRQGRVEMPLRVDRDGEAVIVSGRGVIRHGTIGLTPITALGGALRVAEPMVIEFRLYGVPWSKSRDQPG